MTAAQRMQARYPQPVRVGDLIGLPVLDDSAVTLGHVREVVRTKENQIELIVAYGGFLGWGTRPVAVPIEVVGIAAGTLPRSICCRRNLRLRQPGCRLAGRGHANRRQCDHQDRPVATLILRHECESQSCDHDLVKPITFLCPPN